MNEETKLIEETETFLHATGEMELPDVQQHLNTDVDYIFQPIDNPKYDWKDYAVAGLAGVGVASILVGAGFGIYKLSKFLRKKKRVKNDSDEFNDFLKDAADDLEKAYKKLED